MSGQRFSLESRNEAVRQVVERDSAKYQGKTCSPNRPRIRLPIVISAHRQLKPDIHHRFWHYDRTCFR
jgi:hypothetical protein